jgi:hypothetical protein
MQLPRRLEDCFIFIFEWSDNGEVPKFLGLYVDLSHIFQCKANHLTRSLTSVANLPDTALKQKIYWAL